MRCQKGDLVIVTSPDFAPNAGRMGTIREAAYSSAWIVDPVSTFLGCQYGDDKLYESDKGTVFEDYKLTPIRPGDLVEDTETANEEETV